MRWKAEPKPVPFAITHIKFHQGWEIFLRCFHDGINVFAVTGILHSTVMENCWRSFCHCHCLLQYRLQREETHQGSVFKHQNWHPLGQNLPLSPAFSTHHNWWSAKKKSRFPKKQQLANFIFPVLFCTAWHSNQTKLLITACEREE